MASAMLVDYITGSAAAKAEGKWSSEVARAGLRHKLGEIVAVGAAAFADLGVRVALHSADMLPMIGEIGWPDCFTLLVTLWYLFTEIGSIIENAGKLGAPIPDWLRKGIAVLQNQASEASGVLVVPGDPVEVGKHEKHEADASPTLGPAVPDQDERIPDPETGGTATLEEIIADLKDVE